MREKPLVLIVDDEHELLEIMSVKLGASGFDPVVAYNAKEGVDAAAKLHPDLVLMDVRMPGGETGTDAALAIKQNPETKDIKIAFLSNLKDPWPATQGDRDRLAKGLGMEDYIDKTADLNVIVARVREMLAKK
ncbi:MAG: response regulator [Minisyncoccia bacterium]|jgi:CheY-like chemotaxis protein